MRRERESAERNSDTEWKGDFECGGDEKMVE